MKQAVHALHMALQAGLGSHGQLYGFHHEALG
jgi:hypothetical protein